MGIVNKAFGVFQKGIGSANSFAQNHMFPAMATDYRALKAGVMGIRRSFSGNFMRGLQFPERGLRRGARAWTKSYAKTGISPMMGAARTAAYPAAAGIGMWGLGNMFGDDRPMST